MSMDKSADDIEKRTSRRRLLRQMARVSLALPLVQWKSLPAWAQRPARRTDKPRKEPAPLPPPTALSPEDDKFLDDLERSSFLFFWEQASPQTGLIKDRCNVHINDTGIVASIASTGFGLSAICIAEKRGYISHQDARLRVIATLVFLWRKLPTHRGFFYHFANINTGERIGTPKSLPSIPHYCSAASLPAASTFRIATSSTWHKQSLTAWTGLGSQKTRLCCPTAGHLRWASCRTSGTTTAN